MTFSTHSKLKHQKQLLLTCYYEISLSVVMIHAHRYKCSIEGIMLM